MGLHRRQRRKKNRKRKHTKSCFIFLGIVCLAQVGRGIDLPFDLHCCFMFSLPFPSTWSSLEMKERKTKMVLGRERKTQTDRHGRTITTSRFFSVSKMLPFSSSELKALKAFQYSIDIVFSLFGCLSGGKRRKTQDILRKMKSSILLLCRMHVHTRQREDGKKRGKRMRTTRRRQWSKDEDGVSFMETKMRWVNQQRLENRQSFCLFLTLLGIELHEQEDGRDDGSYSAPTAASYTSLLYYSFNNTWRGNTEIEKEMEIFFQGSCIETLEEWNPLFTSQSTSIAPSSPSIMSVCQLKGIATSLEESKARVTDDMTVLIFCHFSCRTTFQWCSQSYGASLVCLLNWSCSLGRDILLWPNCVLLLFSLLSCCFHSFSNFLLSSILLQKKERKVSNGIALKKWWKEIKKSEVESESEFIPSNYPAEPYSWIEVVHVFECHSFKHYLTQWRYTDKRNYYDNHDGSRSQDS